MLQLQKCIEIIINANKQNACSLKWYNSTQIAIVEETHTILQTEMSHEYAIDPLFKKQNDIGNKAKCNMKRIHFKLSMTNWNQKWQKKNQSNCTMFSKHTWCYRINCVVKFHKQILQT